MFTQVKEVILCTVIIITVSVYMGSRRDIRALPTFYLSLSMNLSMLRHAHAEIDQAPCVLNTHNYFEKPVKQGDWSQG